MANPEHVEWLLEGSNVWNTLRRRQPFSPDLVEADLRDANLHAADLREADLTGTILSSANLAYTRLAYANLRDANLQGANLIGANLKGANLTGANLRGAILTEAELVEADLTGADLRGANLRRAMLRDTKLRGAIVAEAELAGANLQGADITSYISDQPPKKTVRTDFTLVRGLGQRQLEHIQGDTGVILPNDLAHPSSWPVWNRNGDEYSESVDVSDKDTPSSNIPTGGPFVFLSYDHRDRERIGIIRERLTDAGIACWWDQDINSGSEWRTEIAQRLKSATVVLTFWTGHSTGSKGVIEEASKAQNGGKLSHVRLDNSELPYGFAETQYSELSNWDGSAIDPRFQSLISVLHDRLYPPAKERILHRIAEAGPVSAVVEQGKIGIKDAPLTGKPPLDDPGDLGSRFDAVVHDCQEFMEQWKELDPNVPSTIERIIEKCHDMAESQVKNWYLWQRQVSYIEIRLAEDQESDWRGTHEIAGLVAQQIKGLKPHLKPEVLPSSKLAPLKTAPEIRFGDEATSRISEASDVVKIVVEAPSSAEVFNNEAREFLKEARNELAEGLDRQDDPNVSVAQSRFRYWRLAIGSLAGFVVTAVTLTAPNIASNLVTNPEAAKTLHKYLEDLLKLLVTFF